MFPDDNMTLAGIEGPVEVEILDCATSCPVRETDLIGNWIEAANWMEEESKL